MRRKRSQDVPGLNLAELTDQLPIGCMLLAQLCCFPLHHRLSFTQRTQRQHQLHKIVAFQNNGIG